MKSVCIIVVNKKKTNGGLWISGTIIKEYFIEQFDGNVQTWPFLFWSNLSYKRLHLCANTNSGQINSDIVQFIILLLHFWRTGWGNINQRTLCALLNPHNLHISNNVFFLAILPLVVLASGTEARESPPKHSAISLRRMHHNLSRIRMFLHNGYNKYKIFTMYYILF